MTTMGQRVKVPAEQMQGAFMLNPRMCASPNWRRGWPRSRAVPALPR